MIDGNQFVGTVTCLLGLTMLAASWINNAFLFQLTIPKTLDARLGRTAARVIIILLGIGFCVLGVAIMMKWVARPSNRAELGQATTRVVAAPQPAV